MAQPEKVATAEELIKSKLMEIWDRKQIGRIYDVYLQNAQVHVPGQDFYGREDVICHVTRRAAAFPDLQCSVLDLIHGDAGGALEKVAIRWEISGHNTGEGFYSAPSGHAVIWRSISHFLIRDGLIQEEWTVDNELSIVRQLGIENLALAAEFLAGASRGAASGGFGEIERLHGQGTPTRFSSRPSDRFDCNEFVRRSIHNIWNWRLVGEIDDIYSEDCLFHSPSDRTFKTRSEFKAYVLSFLAVMSDLTVYTDDVWSTDDGRESYRTTARWTLLGTHDGPGLWGKPTGRRIYITGISIYHLKRGRVIEEWTECGELSVLRCLFTPQEVESSEGLMEKNSAAIKLIEHGPSSG